MDGQRTNESLTDSTTHLQTEQSDISTDNLDIPGDSLYSLLNGSSSFPSDMDSRLPKNSVDYFKSIEFPKYLPDSFTINYFSKRIPFQLKDFYIFNKRNRYHACEYLALIDTTDFIEVIVQQCVEMENWICLYVLDNYYNVIDFEILINSGVGSMEESSIEFDNQTIEFADFVDTLKYQNDKYNIFRSDIYVITDEEGHRKDEIGFQKVRLLTVSQTGKIVSKDSVTIKKDYIEIYEALNK